MAQTDTGLHISMRLLLGIIAGLLISDMLKSLVKTIDAGGYSWDVVFQNLFIVLAATLFLIRIVVDNVLYYDDPDARTTRAAYGARVLLIFLDLASYALCYHIVAVVEPSAGKTAIFPTATTRTVAVDMAIVEALHWIWSEVALRFLPVSSAEQLERIPLLKRWRTLSGVFALLSTVIWLALRCITVPPWSGAIVFSLSLGSAITYMVLMRDQQYLGPPSAWKAESL